MRTLTTHKKTRNVKSYWYFELGSGEEELELMTRKGWGEQDVV